MSQFDHADEHRKLIHAYQEAMKPALDWYANRLSRFPVSLIVNLETGTIEPVMSEAEKSLRKDFAEYADLVWGTLRRHPYVPI